MELQKQQQVRKPTQHVIMEYIQSVDDDDNDNDDQLLDAEESEVESALQKMAQTTAATPTSTSALNRHACLSRTSASPGPS